MLKIQGHELPFRLYWEFYGFTCMPRFGSVWSSLTSSSPMASGRTLASFPVLSSRQRAPLCYPKLGSSLLGSSSQPQNRLPLASRIFYFIMHTWFPFFFSFLKLFTAIYLFLFSLPSLFFPPLFPSPLVPSLFQFSWDRISCSPGCPWTAWSSCFSLPRAGTAGGAFAFSLTCTCVALNMGVCVAVLHWREGWSAALGCSWHVPYSFPLL